MNVDIDDPVATKAVRGVAESIILLNTTEFPDMHVSRVEVDGDLCAVLLMVDNAREESFLDEKAGMLKEILEGRISGCDIKVSFIPGSCL